MTSPPPASQVDNLGRPTSLRQVCARTELHGLKWPTMEGAQLGASAGFMLGGSSSLVPETV